MAQPVKNPPAVHGIARSRTQLSDFTLFFHFHAWEKEMATHSSILAWETPWTVARQAALSMGSQESHRTW